MQPEVYQHHKNLLRSHALNKLKVDIKPLMQKYLMVEYRGSTNLRDYCEIHGLHPYNEVSKQLNLIPEETKNLLNFIKIGHGYHGLGKSGGGKLHVQGAPGVSVICTKYPTIKQALLNIEDHVNQTIKNINEQTTQYWKELNGFSK